VSRERVVVVVKRSAYSRFIEQERDARARRLLKRRDPTVVRWPRAHREHVRTVELVVRELERLGADVTVVRRAHASFDTEGASLVVAVGGDGTLLGASHNVGATPILGVNSAPGYSVGFFCGADAKSARRMLARALDGTLPSVSFTRMAVRVNDQLRAARVLNEALFCHVSPAATSRYILRYGRVREEQKSSGFWIGPAAGSTAAQRSAGGRVLPAGSRRLQLVVREPYTPDGRRYRLSKLLVEPGRELLAHSKMQKACLFLDGPHMRIEVVLGDVVGFRASDEPLTVLALGRDRIRGSNGD
jgi:NAD+ kinase